MASSKFKEQYIAVEIKLKRNHYFISWL